jgi:hypothetical protein
VLVNRSILGQCAYLMGTESLLSHIIVSRLQKNSYYNSCLTVYRNGHDFGAIRLPFAAKAAPTFCFCIGQLN